MKINELALFIHKHEAQFQDDNGYLCKSTICQRFGLTEDQWKVLCKELDKLHGY